MQLPYNSPASYLIHVLFSQCVYFPINGPGRPENPGISVCAAVFLLMTAIGGRPKPELCFLLGRLRWTLLPKESYGNSLSGCASNTQPSNWKADTLPLS